MTVGKIEPAFSQTEYRERLHRARVALRQAGMDGVLCIAPEHLNYFVGYDAHTFFDEQALIFSVDDDEPTLIVRDGDIGTARAMACVGNQRAYNLDEGGAALLAGRVTREKGLLGGTLGIEYGSFALNVGYYLRLLDALGSKARLKDSTSVLGWLRAIKSKNELSYVRRAQACNLAGVAAAMATGRPGMTEVAWAGEIEHALRMAGSDYSAMPTWMWSGPRTSLGHATPTDRVLCNNEPAMFSFAGVVRRYHVSTYHSVHFGKPSARYRDLFEVAQEALRAQLDQVRDGGPVAAAANAGATVVRRAGLEEFMNTRWGYGVGLGYPPSWLEPLQISEDSEATFAPGMVCCIHVGIAIPEEGHGVLVGSDYLITETGCEPLDTTGGAPESRSLPIL